MQLRDVAASLAVGWPQQLVLAGSSGAAGVGFPGGDVGGDPQPTDAAPAWGDLMAPPPLGNSCANTGYVLSQR